MPVTRHENTLSDSPVRAVVTFYGEGIGEIGSRFNIQGQNYSNREMPIFQLADFLNEATGKNGKPRTISESVEKGIVSDFASMLNLENDQYTFIGVKSNHPYWEKSNFSYSESQQQYSEREGLLASANSKQQSPRFGNFTSNSSIGVLQHEVAVTDAGSDKPILGTFGAGPCIIVAAYNPESKKTFLAHVDALSTLSSLPQYFDRISSGSATKLQIHLSGGDSSTLKQAGEIIKLINERNDTEIKSSNVGIGGAPKSLAIDSRNGEIFTDFMPSQLDTGKDASMRMGFLSFQTTPSPLRKTFDGTKPQDVSQILPITDYSSLVASLRQLPKPRSLG